MKDLKAYKPLQFDYPKSKSGGWESNSVCFSAVAFFIQTAPNALLIHASIAVPLNLNLLQPLGTKFMIWEVTLWLTVWYAQLTLIVLFSFFNGHKAFPWSKIKVNFVCPYCFCFIFCWFICCQLNTNIIFFQPTLRYYVACFSWSTKTGTSAKEAYTLLL